MNNPYLDEVITLCDDMMFIRREELIKKYSFAIPSEEALNLIAKYSPIIEVGSGGGYWAYCLKQLGVDILCFDCKKEYKHNVEHDKWCKARNRSEEISKDYPERTLFLCWASYNTPMAYNCIKAFKGKNLIYIGEEEGGCTANEDFYNYVGENFNLIKQLNIPQWLGIHDDLTIWERRE